MHHIIRDLQAVAAKVDQTQDAAADAEGSIVSALNDLEEQSGDLVCAVRRADELEHEAHSLFDDLTNDNPDLPASDGISANKLLSEIEINCESARNCAREVNEMLSGFDTTRLVNHDVDDTEPSSST